jgi:hypothetical protein
MSVAQFCDQLVDELERKILEIGPDKVAAFFAEPIMGAGGVIVPPPGYHQRTWEICKKYDVLYVSDEVVTRFGRLGQWFASKDVFGIEPDLIVSAKASRPATCRSAPSSSATDLRRDLIARSRCLVHPRLHLFGPSGRLRGRAQDHRDHGESATSAATCARSAPCSSSACTRSRTCRWSATCAAAIS